jgi:hypothetical protein
VAGSKVKTVVSTACIQISKQHYADKRVSFFSEQDASSRTHRA